MASELIPDTVLINPQDLKHKLDGLKWDDNDYQATKGIKWLNHRCSSLHVRSFMDMVNSSCEKISGSGHFVKREVEALDASFDRSGTRRQSSLGSSGNSPRGPAAVVKPDVADQPWSKQFIDAQQLLAVYRGFPIRVHVKG